MDKIIEWGPKVLEVFGAFVVFMTVVASVTPSKKDDEVVSWLEKIGALADRLGVQLKSRK